MQDRRRAARLRTAALLAALAGGLVIPEGPPGIGVVAVAFLVAAAALTQARPSRDLSLFGGLALALASISAVLDAQWVVRADLAAAWVCAGVAVCGPRLGALLAPFTALRQAPTVVPDEAAQVAPALRATLIAVGVAVPFAVLFLTADAAFATIADEVPRPELASAPARIATFVLVLLGSLGLGLAATKRLRARAGRSSGRLSRVEWLVPLAVLDALFLAFVAVQLSVLFGGNDHVLRTAGLTYAEYARQGFWQLIAAAALTLVVVKAATLVARAETHRDRQLLNAMLGVLCVLTLVVLASALHRLSLYEDAYGLTRLRLTAEAFSLWLAGVFGLVIALGTARRAEWLARLALAWTGVALVAGSLANPDGRIAERNVALWRESGRIDTQYLSTLSADAVPALGELPLLLRRRAQGNVARRLDDDEPWSSANLSRARARDSLD
jgi:hypothetical protein